MSATLDAVLTGRVYQCGRAVRRTSIRHTHLSTTPFGIVVWRLGGERFRAAAVAWGPVGGEYKLAVAGEPRNRDLYFAALAPFARDLCARIQRIAAVTEEYKQGNWVQRIPVEATQLVVANRATVNALGLLGRYLAYLSDRNGQTPDPDLVEAGKHLRFYAKHSRIPGQALIVALDRLVAEHWVTLQSPLEQANLAALDAQIEPAFGKNAFEAGTSAERTLHVGPEPPESVDRKTMALLQRFNEQRKGSVDSATVKKLIGPLTAHYRALVDPVWELMGRVHAREADVEAAPSTVRRYREDRVAFGRHVEWVVGQGGRYRTTDTPRQAATTLRTLEEAQRRLQAEMALEDPLCMVPYLLDGDAIDGTVVHTDIHHRAQGPKNMVNRPEITLDTDDPAVLPDGKALWWTDNQDKDWKVISTAARGGGTRVRLQLQTKYDIGRVPAAGSRVILSELHVSANGYAQPLPQNPPWCHRPDTPPPPPAPIDGGDGETPPPPVDGDTLPNPESYT